MHTSFRRVEADICMGAQGMSLGRRP